MLKVFGTTDLYCRFLCLLWMGEGCAGLGVTSSLRDSSLQLTKDYFTSLKQQEAQELLKPESAGHYFYLLLIGKFYFTFTLLVIEF
jgi:hypothetical protein